MKQAILHGPRDLRLEPFSLDTENLGRREIWVQTEITALKIGTDRGNYEGAERVPGAQRSRQGLPKLASRPGKAPFREAGTESTGVRRGSAG